MSQSLDALVRTWSSVAEADRPALSYAGVAPEDMDRRELIAFLYHREQVWATRVQPCRRSTEHAIQVRVYPSANWSDD